MERPLRTRYTLNGGNSITLSDCSYDELGRLTSDHRNGNPKLTTTYTYNLQGLTTSISTPLFSEALFYEQTHNSSAPQYGGNISAMDWQVTESDKPKQRGYAFSYDALSRLTAARYSENGKSSSNYSTSYTYDLMGNILTLKRNGLLDDGSYATIDDLTYSYNGNQVVKIDDASDENPCYDGGMHFIDGANEEEEYSYDANGNMTSDLNKRILHIEYNELNLPKQINVEAFYVGSGLNNTIKYTYATDGRKLRAEYNTMMQVPVSKPSTGGIAIGGGSLIGRGTIIGGGRPSTSNVHTSTIDYCSNLIYEDKKLSTILFDGGYASVDEDGNVAMHYYVKDHLGSNRLVVDENGNIEEINHYYPFGALMGDSKNVKKNKYKYVGKELDCMHGIDMQDHFMRCYDILNIKWNRLDNLSEKYYAFSPYAYSKNNPILYFDSRGDSLSISSNLISVLYNGINEADRDKLVFVNGILDPSSIPVSDNNIFLQDLLEISQNPIMVEVRSAKTITYLDTNGQVASKPFMIPYDYTDSFNRNLLYPGEDYGKHIQGNLGQSLFPLNVKTLSNKHSLDNNVTIILNSNGTLNHQTVGLAHEFGHIVLFLRGKSFGHSQPGVDKFIYIRATYMSKRLGYDY